MDNEMLNIFYQRYSREIYLYLYSLSGNSVLSEDLLQETFLKALLSLSDSHTNVRAWLYVVARNLYFNTLKKEKRKTSLEEMQQKSDEGSNTLFDEIMRDENRKLLYNAMRKLELRKREVLQMQYFGNLSQKEIAAILHITPENVRVLSYRARRELKSYLEAENYDIP